MKVSKVNLDQMIDRSQWQWFLLKVSVREIIFYLKTFIWKKTFLKHQSNHHNYLTLVLLQLKMEDHSERKLNCEVLTVTVFFHFFFFFGPAEFNVYINYTCLICFNTCFWIIYQISNFYLQIPVFGSLNDFILVCCNGQFRYQYFLMLEYQIWYLNVIEYFTFSLLPLFKQVREGLIIALLW